MRNITLLLISFCYLASGNVQGQIDGDINHFGTYNFSHDENNCLSSINPTHQTNISNSFLGDSVKFIGWGGNLMYVEENTTGNPNWMVFPVIFDGGIVMDDMIAGGMLNTVAPSQLWKIISGPDTLYNPIAFVNEVVLNPCTYGNVNGSVYIDNNTDCIFNSGDIAVSSVAVGVNSSYTSPGGSYLNSTGFYTGMPGTFSGQLQESWLQNYTLSMPSIYAFIFPPSTCSPLSYTFTTLPQTNVDFAVQCADVDASVYMGSNGAVRPMIPFNVFPNVSNIGCDPVSGTLKLVLDPNVTYNAANSTNPATSINGDTLYWNYSNLTNASGSGFWNSFFGGVNLTPSISVNIGDTLCFKVIADIPVNDVNIGNNELDFCLPVVNSYDPNIKEVEPKGIGPEGYIYVGTPKLRYTIHFQNTGNAPALNINVIDTLGLNVIANTLRIIDASHTMTPQWTGPNVVSFMFNGINLPDSTSNEAQSHGYVTFEIDMVQGLASGTEIKNKAEIYFDFNPPIVTNYALNTIAFPLGLEDLTDNDDDFSVVAFPNPMSEFVHFEINNNGEVPANVQLKLVDLSGKEMLNEVYNKAEIIKINRGNLTNGIYIYEVIDLATNQSKFGKLVVR
jgi:hypothetical protein